MVAATEKVWGEYVPVVCQILAKRNTKMSETGANLFYLVSHSQMASLKDRLPLSSLLGRADNF